VFLVQSVLRKQLLEHLTQSTATRKPGKPRNLKSHVLNTLFAEYLAAAQYTCTLSVFLPEASLEDSVPLLHGDILSSLCIQPGSPLHRRIQSELKKSGVSPSIVWCQAACAHTLWDDCMHIPVINVKQCTRCVLQLKFVQFLFGVSLLKTERIIRRLSRA
jgi:hypothetical protein